MTDGLMPKPPGRVRGRPFEKGRSGNPAGRRVGCRNKTTIAAASLLAGEAEALTRKAVELALGGDASALRLCLEHLGATPRPPGAARPAANQERRRCCRHDGRAYRRSRARRDHPRRGGRAGEGCRHPGAVDRDERFRPTAADVGGPAPRRSLMLARSAVTRAANRDGSDRFRSNRRPLRGPRRRCGVASESAQPSR